MKGDAIVSRFGGLDLYEAEQWVALCEHRLVEATGHPVAYWRPKLTLPKRRHIVSRRRSCDVIELRESFYLDDHMNDYPPETRYRVQKRVSALVSFSESVKNMGRGS